MSLVTMGDGPCPGAQVVYSDSITAPVCTCPPGYIGDPRPGRLGVCIPSAGGGMFSGVKAIASAMAVPAGTPVPGSIGTPVAGTTSTGAAALVTSAPSGVAAPSGGRLGVWLAIGGVAALGAVLLLRRRRGA